MKILIAIAVILFSTAASASTFVKVTELDVDPRGIVWNYEFSVKSSPVAVSTPLFVTEYSCYKIWHDEKVLITAKEWRCAKDEAAARVLAQADADKFEQDKIKNGESTTAIEAKRLLNKVKP